MPDESLKTLAPDVAAVARDYFSAFLSPPAVERSMDALGADAAFFDDDTVAEVLANAHLILEAELDIPEHLEALTLVDEVGLQPDQVAPILGLSPSQVRDRIDRALVEVGEQPRYSEDADRAPPVVVIEADDRDRLAPDTSDSQGPAFTAFDDDSGRSLRLMGMVALALAILFAITALVATGTVGS